jgi:hypothetical protein
MKHCHLWLLASVLATSLVACSSGEDKKNDSSAETHRELEEANDAYMNELTNAIAAASWPANYAPMAGVIHQRSTAEDMLIPDPPRYASVMVKFYQHCAWSMAWLDANATGDAGRADAAMNVLLDPSLYSEIDPESRDYLLGLARDASLGDPTGLQNVVDQSCLPDDWIERS